MTGNAMTEGLRLPTLAPAAQRQRLHWIRRRLGVLMVSVAAAEVGLLVAFATGVGSMATWLAGHGLLVGVVWHLHRRSTQTLQSIPPAVGTLFLLATATLGPIGSLGALLTAALLRTWGPHVHTPDAWLAPEAELDSARSRGLYRRLQRHTRAGVDPSRVAPFSDVLASGTVEQKQAVVALIATRFQPAFGPALRGALGDADPAVRVLAAAAAARIENDFLPASMDLENRHARDRNNFELKWTLARHYDQYANTGLLDEARSLSARERALALYAECAEVRPQDSEILHARIRLLVRLGRDDEAIDMMTPIVAQGRVPPETLTWYVESLFKLARYGPLHETCRLLQLQPHTMASLPEACREAVALWSPDLKHEVESLHHDVATR